MPYFTPCEHDLNINVIQLAKYTSHGSGILNIVRLDLRSENGNYFERSQSILAYSTKALYLCKHTGSNARYRQNSIGKLFNRKTLLFQQRLFSQRPNGNFIAVTADQSSVQAMQEMCLNYSKACRSRKISCHRLYTTMCNA